MERDSIDLKTSKVNRSGRLTGVNWLLLVYGCLLSQTTAINPLLAEQVTTTNGSSAVTIQPQAGMRILAGEVTANSALVQVRSTKLAEPSNGEVVGEPAFVEFMLKSVETDMPTLRQRARTLPERDFIARVKFSGLRPNSSYRCETRFGKRSSVLRKGPVVDFKTHPGPELAEPVSFVVVTGMNYAKYYAVSKNDRDNQLAPPHSGAERRQGYPALQSILKLQPHFFVGTGDNVYYDRPAENRARTRAEMRLKWYEQFDQPRFQKLLAEVPTLWMVDDHDYRRDDCDNSGNYLPLPETARQVLLEELPFAPFEEPAAKTYRTYRVSGDLQIWLTENRMYRSPNDLPDGPEKTIWGDEQAKWLRQTLLASDATFKLLISPTPMIGPDDLRKKDNHCNVGGFRHERDAFFEFLTSSELSNQNFYIVCGDRHWQYHALHPSGLEEFSCGALVDANARLGRLPGDQAGTDPHGLIKHLHVQTEPSGGFLAIDCQPASNGAQASLSFSFYDELGNLLYRCKK